MYRHEMSVDAFVFKKKNIFVDTKFRVGWFCLVFFYDALDLLLIGILETVWD